MPDATGRPTLGDLIAEIEDDIERADLNRQVTLAVERAIRRFQVERFFFNEGAFTFVTLPGTDIYGGGDATDLPDLMAIDSVVLVEDGHTTVLQRVDETWIEAADDAASSAYPCAYSYFGRSLRLWPLPSGEWTIRVTGHVRLPVPASLDETNAWTDEASSLIAAGAKLHLARNALADPKLAMAQTLAIEEERRLLRGRSNVIASSGAIRAYHL